jgi:PTS system nitrogen regulatory IIA component
MGDNGNLMNLASLLDPDLIAIDLKAKTKIEAVEQLSELFCKKFPTKDKEAILKAIAEREELGSTSLGRGFAFPHARTNAVSDLHIVVGLDRQGATDKGPDEMPIKVICLFLTPLNISRLYLQALSGLANIARRPGMLDQMLDADTPEKLIGTISDTGIQIREALTVSDIMTHDVAKVSPDDSLRAVANAMFAHNLDTVPVVDSEGKLIGEVSGKGLIRSALPDYEKLIANRPELEPFEILLRQGDKLRVRDVMRDKLATITETASLFEAAAAMISHDVDRLMVTNNGKLMGVITASNIISKIIRG